MKTTSLSLVIMALLAISIAIIASRCSGGRKAIEADTPQIILTNETSDGTLITVSFTRGESHNHPLMAIWIEDSAGKYLETLFVAESIGKGIFQHGEKTDGQWMPGPVRRPAALPYWGHQRGIRAADGYYLPTPEEPVADAITGPTPQGNFILKGKSTAPLPGKFKVMLEINQSWDWNEYWTNVRYPDDIHYKTSSQPALVYQAIIDMENIQEEYQMVPIGHSHYSGLDGTLNSDLGTLTTALKIADRITVKVVQ